jgi:hypothetical protein
LQEIEDWTFDLMDRKAPFPLIIGSVAIRHGVILTLQQVVSTYKPRYNLRGTDVDRHSSFHRAKTILEEIAALKMLVLGQQDALGKRESTQSRRDTRNYWTSGCHPQTITDKLTESFAKARKLSKESYLQLVETVGEHRGCSVGERDAKPLKRAIY